MLSAYLELIRIRFLTMLAYRVNYYSGILIYALNIWSSYFIWKATYAYSGSGAIGGLTFEQITTYTVVGWMARAFYFNNLDRDIASEIRDGSVAVQFIRPYSYVVVKMMQGLGEGLFRLLLFTTPGMVIVSLLFPVRLPADARLWAVFLVMLLFAFLINSQINIITGLFSGLILPISFFPGWAAGLLKVLPFQAITYLPSSVFTGKLAGAAVWQALGVQALWFALLLVPMTWLWRRARTRLFVQGG
ncbi:daunorubicin ABC transporter permease [Gordoniibacillus kamchatkensis]|uniref:Daunorubicin ABC transporter permease n=1 Tax=Gordoniibacillus kamchatkensis TaxID=1590651 RepID=A0ABR5AFJ3_9BACL|nr:daunorubicin ABC transporter permease [Paenibacillus sp. VKM B-2647]KIL39667.1 daunorubicin ABC transporter permease [Paenibacillus sp. VKM B-2647]